MSLKDLSTCEISDVLIKLGIKNGGLLPDIDLISHDADTRICAPAYTVKMVFTSNANTLTLKDHFVDTVPKDHAIVIDAPLEAHNAVWGGLMSAGARARGAAGVIISGRCRDIQEHRSLGFPVFARGHSTVGQSPFTRPIAVNVALSLGGKDEEVTGFPAVTVEPGDWMVADEDGVVCVPQRMVPQVVEGALKGREIDEKCMEDIKAGKGVQASFKKYRGKL
ncbi:RraA-like protein [Fistulina hepatica ATCC 64428]|uniref:RraA-like protein n=1 Tax=Fistulina hepatica ATCC 64428 TaxID=1128425 RepID=A0A0D7A3C7_9AGAR|nr:RraA-like protein [Fistulina hepatica ATCC 64428]